MKTYPITSNSLFTRELKIASFFVVLFFILLITAFKSEEQLPDFNTDLLPTETNKHAGVLPADPPQNFKHQTAHVNGINIHYVIGGSGEPLILLHGFGQNWYMWNRILPELSKYFTVIAPDLRGIGESDKPEDGYDKKTMASDIHELVKQLGYQHINLAGHDIGLMVAYAYAAQYSEEVNKLALLDALLPGVEPVWTQLSNTIWHFGFFQRPVAASLIAGHEREFFQDFWPQQLGSNKAAFHQAETNEFIRAYATDGSIRGSLNWYKYFKQDVIDNHTFMMQPLQMPVLAMAGEYSTASFLADHLNKIATNVKEVKIMGAGHWLVQEQTDAVQKELLQFFTSDQTNNNMMYHAATFLNKKAPTTEEKATPRQLVDALHTAFGEHHARAVHAKGIILTGEFTPHADAANWTKAFHLQKTKSKVIIRFSDFTGIPNIPDNAGAANPRGLAIKFIMPDGANTDIVGHSFNGFPTPTPDEFRELLLAIGASGPDASKPTALDQFLASHPVAKTFLTTQKTPASFATINYYGVNAFKFTNAKGESHYIRYQFIPVSGEQLITPEQADKAGPDYLVTEIKNRIAKHSFEFYLYAEIAADGDKIEDPSIAWPENRKKVLLGVINITKLSSNAADEDKALFFIPNNLPDGIETADPMLDFRAKAYPISVKERQ